MANHERAKRSYAQRYCSLHGLPVEKFTDHVFRRSLHAPLRWAWPLVGWILRDSFEIDRQTVATVGRFHSRRELREELIEFSYHPRNRHFSRRVAGQRISTNRLRSLLRNLPE